VAVRKGEGGRGKGVPQAASVDDDVDALFQLPLAEFTAARNALAARLKKAGRSSESDQVKALPKPSLPAWTVNQLYHRKRDAFDRLIATGERFRQAQASQFAGKSADIRGPLEARRAALSELAKLAAATLKEAGSNPNPDTMRRITTTLEALSTYGALPDAPRGGRLTDDVDPPGFETLAALVPRVGKSNAGAGPSRIIPFQHTRPARATKRKSTPEEDAQQAAAERKAQVAAAKAAVQEGERTLRDARRDAQQAEDALKKAAARAKETEKEKTEAEQRLEKAAAEADAARQQARKIAAEAEEAAQAVEDAERSLEKAERELLGLDA
jgi:DNA repair exonuclease SbcCD ATPase subunit